MKIVFASYVYSPGFSQPEQWLSRIKSYACILESLAKEHTVISIEHIDYEGEQIQNGVTYKFNKSSKVSRRLPWRTHGYIKSLEPDIVFIHGLHFSFQIIQLRLQLGAKVKIMAQHHAEQPYQGFKKIIQRMADQYIDAYLFVSRAMGMQWVNSGNLASPQKLHGVMEISSVFYRVNKKQALAETGVTGSPVFLWVGRLNANKNPLTVVSAFLNFAKANSEARLYMIYQTTELLPDILELLDQYPGQWEAIVLVGKVAHLDLLYWFNSATFIVSGSHYEGSGTAICEAMSCGCIPVVTDILPFRMMTDNGKCGLLYPPGNDTALLATLLHTMDINVAQKRDAALNYYKEALSFDAIARRIGDIAASLCV